MNFWRNSIGWGFLVGALAHIPAQFALASMTKGISLIAIGLSQLVYLVPLIVIAARKSSTEMAKGLLIVAGITFLLNAACFGFIFVAFGDL